MKITATEIENKIDALLAVLDKDIEQVTENLAMLDQMRALVIKRDEAQLGKLLEKIRLKSQIQGGNEQRRQQLRSDLAQAMGCEFGEFTLSKLENLVSETKREEVSDRKNKLRSLTTKLKTEYVATASLLADCARFNRMLLEKIFKFSKTTAMQYNSKGSTQRQTDAAMLNIKF